MRDAGAAVGISHSSFGRIERSETQNISVALLCRASAAVGLQLSLRLYPRGDVVRDAAHTRLLLAFRARLPPGSSWAAEVPLPIPGDLRALDARTTLDRVVGIEAETHLTDLQALERRLLLKKRDARIDVLILLVADTRNNREVLDAHRESLRAGFPLDTRRVLGYISRGQAPPADGIVVLRATPPASGSR